MKKVILLFIVFISGCYNTAVAQSFELSSGSEIYVCDSTSIRILIRNKNNVIHELIKKEPHCLYDTPDKLSSMFHVYRSVLPKEKIDKWAKEQKGILLVVYCDSTGKVLEVDFRLFDNLRVPDDITIAEIELLEKAFKSQTINLNQNCPDVRYFRFGYRCSFKDLAKQED